MNEGRQSSRVPWTIITLHYLEAQKAKPEMFQKTSQIPRKCFRETNTNEYINKSEEKQDNTPLQLEKRRQPAEVESSATVWRRLGLEFRELRLRV